MARTPVTVTKVSRLVVVPMSTAVNDATNDLQLVNDGHTILLVKNNGVVNRIAEAVIVETIDGVLPAPLSYTITPGAEVPLGPYPVQEYGALLAFNLNSTDLAVRAISLFAPPL